MKMLFASVDGVTNEVNPCYGININNNDDDATYCEIPQNETQTQSVTTSQLYNSIVYYT